MKNNKNSKIVKPNLAAIKDIRQRRRTYLKYVKDFYNINNRGFNTKNNLCQYAQIENSPGCAIGQFLSPKTAKKLDKESAEGIYGVMAAVDTCKLIPQWMEEMHPEFLHYLQCFHDRKENWDANGLSSEGKIAYAGIRKHFKL